MANPNDSGCIDFVDCQFGYDPQSKSYVLVGPFGEECIAPANVAGQLLAPNAQGQCFLQLQFNGVNCGQVNLTPLLDKVTLPDVAPLGITFDPIACALNIAYDNLSTPVSIPLTAILGKIKVRAEWDAQTCVLTFIDQNCQITTMNIGADILAKVPRPSLTKDVLPDGTGVLYWSNGYGQNSFCTIPAVSIDLDNASLTSDGVLTLNYGGDGNPGQVIVDICAIVGANCNSYFTQITPYGWTYVDNNGQPQTWAFPQLPTLQDKSGDVLAAASAYTILQPDDFDSAGTEPPANAQLLAFSPSGQCIAYDVPVIPEQVTKDEIVKDFISIPAAPAGSQFLFVDPTTGDCRRAPVPIPDVPPEVWIGGDQPDKADGYLVWFDPATCIIRFCDDDGGWRQPSRVICQADEPSTDKGEYDLWYDTNDQCLNVLCDGVWIGTGGNSFIEQIVIPDYCLRVEGQSSVILPQVLGDPDDNKYVFDIPAPTELIETCIRIDGVAAPIVPHLEDNGTKWYLDLPAYPTIPEIPDPVTKEDIVGEFTEIDSIPSTANVLIQLSNGSCRKAPLPEFPEIPVPITKEDIVGEFTEIASIPATATVLMQLANGECRRAPLPVAVTPPVYEVKGGSTNVTVDTETVDGVVCYTVSVEPQSIPDLPDFCIFDKAGNRLDAVVNPNTGKITLPLPPILACQADEPATDGSEGCLWFDADSGCLHVLCDSTWISSNTQITQ